MTALAITGATGFVGGHVLSAALAAGHRVQALTRRMTQVNHASVEPQPIWIEGTLEAPAALAMLCEGVDAVIHIAGAVNVPTRAAFAAANIAGTQAVLDAATAAGVHRFIHISSLAAREPALSDYGWSKAEAERAVMASDRDWTIVRPPGVYGDGDSDMLDLFKMARRGFLLTPPAGRGSWIHASDLAALLLILGVEGGARALYEPDDGTPSGTSHSELARLIGSAVGRPNPFTLAAPRWLLGLAARADRLMRGDKAKLTPDRARYMAHPDWVADPASAVPIATWQPRIPLPQGLAATADWYRSVGWL